MRRDDADVFELHAQGEPSLTPDHIVAALQPLLTPARWSKLVQVAAQRLLCRTLVIEELADPHNVSAVLRSADAFGIDRIHIVAGEQGLHAAHRVAKGAERWLDLRWHDDMSSCVSRLRREGFRIYAAAMNGQVGLSELAASPEPVAIVFGNEHRGVRPETRALVDGLYSIPMVGFVESLNVSVAAAITLHALRTGEGAYAIGAAEQQEILARFLMRSVRDAAGIVSEYVDKTQNEGGN